MKTEYLIHEYMWSNHCISGNKLGWGIVASSIPEDRTYLRELEKVAQAAVVDKTGRIEVEELVYSPVCGFVKMTSIPCEAEICSIPKDSAELWLPSSIRGSTCEWKSITDILFSLLFYLLNKLYKIINFYSSQYFIL